MLYSPEYAGGITDTSIQQRLELVNVLSYGIERSGFYCRLTVGVDVTFLVPCLGAKNHVDCEFDGVEFNDEDVLR